MRLRSSTTVPRILGGRAAIAQVLPRLIGQSGTLCLVGQANQRLISSTDWGATAADGA